MSEFQPELFSAAESVSTMDLISAIDFAEPKLNARSKEIHEKTIRRSKTYLAAEADLLESIMEIDRDRTYEKFGQTHLTPYCVHYLGLTSDVAANFVRVARKSEQVPELKKEISHGGLTVTKAKTIVSVITSENKEDWIAKAKTLSKEKLELEVANAQPKAPKPEKAKPVGAERFRVEFEFTLEEMQMLRRAQDVISQSLGKSASLAETQREALKVFLIHRDPVQKAERAQVRSRKRNQCKTPSSKETLAEPKDSAEKFECMQSEAPRDCSQLTQVTQSKKPRHYHAALIHALNLRDKRRCQARLPDGSNCGSAKWVQFHHIVEVERGGKDTLENMISLCSSHHRAWHRRQK